MGVSLLSHMLGLLLKHCIAYCIKMNYLIHKGQVGSIAVFEGIYLERIKRYLIILSRVLKVFENEFGGKLELIHREYCTNALRYLLSGGLNFRKMLPDFLLPLVILLEQILSPLSRFWSLHEVIVIRRH